LIYFSSVLLRAEITVFTDLCEIQSTTVMWFTEKKLMSHIILLARNLNGRSTLFRISSVAESQLARISDLKV